MVRLSYVVEPLPSGGATIQPVNLAFAAAAAARASWASKERDENLWDFEQLDDGGLPADSVVNGSTFPAATPAIDTDAAPVALPSPPPQPPPPPPQAAPRPPRISSVVDLAPATAPPGASSPLPPSDTPGIHDIPRNSVLFRTHAAQQNMTSSLPLAEANAPSAKEVAAVMEERKSRGMMSEEVRAALMAASDRGSGGGRISARGSSTRGLPLRSASFSSSAERVPAATLRSPADTGSGSCGNSATGLAGSRKASYNNPYVSVGTALSACGTVPITASGCDGDDDGERDGCLVLPVLRNLLALQDGGPKPPGTKHVNHALTSMQSQHAHSHGHLHGGLSFGGHVSSSGGVTRQASQHALRASASMVLSGGGGSGGSGGGGGGGGTLTRQVTQTTGSSSSPARRRVMAAAAAAAAAAVEPAAAGRASPVRRQLSSIRAVMSYPMCRLPVAVGGASSPPPLPLPPEEEEGDLLLTFGEMLGGVRVSSGSTSTSQSSPMHSFTHQQGGRGSRPGTNTGMGPEASDGAAAGREASPLTRPYGSTAARMGSIKTLYQPQLPQPPPLSPTAPTAAKSPKTAKALFAWTHKLGKGKWPWTSSSGGAAAAGTTSPGDGGGGSGGTSLHGQELTPPVAHGPPGLGLEAAAAAAATAAAAAAAAGGVVPSSSAVLRASTSSNGRTSMNGRTSGNGRQSSSGVPTGQQQQHLLVQQLAVAAAGTPLGLGLLPRDHVLLPPIEHHPWRKLPGGGGQYPAEPPSPTGLRTGGPVLAAGVGSGASKR